MDEVEVIQDLLREMRRDAKASNAQLSELVGWKDSVKENVERFWLREWPEVTETLRAHDLRLRALESAIISLQEIPVLVKAIQAEVERNKLDIAKLDRWKVKVVSWVAGAGAFGSVVGTGIIILISKFFNIP